jgi:predicted HicB family RNase H-like nuclease
MPLSKDKRLFVRLESELHDKAHAKAAADGIKLSEVIRRLLLKWLRGEVNPS